MILTGSQIQAELSAGSIVIHPFEPRHVGPNSYDVTLNPQLLVYSFKDRNYIDMQSDNPTDRLIIPPDGLVLEPNCLYLGCTNESAVSKKFVPLFEGRSSIGRLGINTHITAGFGDIGWGYTPGSDGELICHYPTWTLEMNVVHPVKVYPNCRIGQVYFLVPMGSVSLYKGKYSTQKEPQASKSFQDFLK